MAREEAIEMLKALNTILRSPDGEPISDMCDALDMAIEALQAQTDGDLISRADAIKYIDRVTNSGLGRNKSLDYIHKYISALPSADRPSGEWIPVSERLPEEPYGCVVTVMDSFFNGCDWDDSERLLPYFVGYDGESWNDADGKTLQLEVIAWMPLPKPYKDGEEE